MSNASRPTRIMSALILRAMVDETVLAEFDTVERRAEMIWAPTMGLMQRVRDGERADAIVAIDWAINELVASGLLDPATCRPLAQAAFGIAVMAGSPHPDISS